jgi:BASS family bile acid:Na+ symporter
MSLLQRYFPLLAIIVSTFAYFWPDWLVNQKSLIIYLLGAVMFCMGSSLTLNDFQRAIQRYPLLLFALVLQFGFMPLIAWQLSSLAGLSTALTAGMILVGSVPGGTASNVICYISKADVALSITLTAISTCIAIVMTPLLAYAYLSHTVEVDTFNMMKSIFYMVLLPVGLGVLLNQTLRRFILPIQKYGADISIVIVCFIIAIIIALNKDNLLIVSPILVGLVLTHNLSGLILGYFTTLLITRNKRLSKTIAIEVGMQNSGLAVTLAVKFFGASSALPGALFSIIHNVTGSLLASYWSKKSH